MLGFIGLSSSTWYSQFKKLKVNSSVDKRGRPVPGYTINPNKTIITDSVIIKILADYRARPEFMNAGGCSKLKHYIRRDYGFYINHKKLYRLCKENGFLLSKVKKKKRRGVKVCMNRIITGPNQLWEFDIKYGYIHGENRFFFILAFIDIFHREVIDYHIGLGCKSGDLKFTLKNALLKVGIDEHNKLVIRSDNGTQMTSFMFQEYISRLSILEHEFTPPSTPNKNAHVESFFSILEIEFLQVRYFRTYADAYKQTSEFINFYNNSRLHGSLNNKTPKETIKAYYAGEVLKIKNLRA